MVGRSYVSRKWRNSFRCDPPCEGLLPKQNRGEPYDPENHVSVTTAAAQTGGSRATAETYAVITTDSDSSPDGLVHTATGAPITEVVKTRNNATGAVETTEYWYTDPTTGELTMTSTDQDIGRNDQAPLQLIQLVGEARREYFTSYADEYITATDLFDWILGTATFLHGFKADGTPVTRGAVDSDYLASVTITLKPVGGGTGVMGEGDGVSTTSEAAVTDTGTAFQNLDAGGSRTYGGLQTNGLYAKCEFALGGQIHIAAGSVVVVSAIVASLPVDETTV